jgi:hypothetical protein
MKKLVVLEGNCCGEGPQYRDWLIKNLPKNIKLEYRKGCSGDRGRMFDPDDPDFEDEVGEADWWWNYYKWETSERPKEYLSGYIIDKNGVARGWDPDFQFVGGYQLIKKAAREGKHLFCALYRHTCGLYPHCTPNCVVMAINSAEKAEIYEKEGHMKIKPGFLGQNFGKTKGKINPELKKALHSDHNNVVITDPNQNFFELGVKFSSPFGNIYIWRGEEIFDPFPLNQFNHHLSLEEMIKKIEGEKILHWEAYHYEGVKQTGRR